MRDSDTEKLRAEVKEDLRDLRADFRSELNSAVARIEASIKAHSEGSMARQSDIVARLQSHDEKQTASFSAISDWKVHVETRLAQHAQSSKITAGVAGAIGAGLISFLFRAMACGPADPVPVPITPPPVSDTTRSGRPAPIK
jgi:hypothetical protein